MEKHISNGKDAPLGGAVRSQRLRARPEREKSVSVSLLPRATADQSAPARRDQQLGHHANLITPTSLFPVCS